VGSGTDPGEGAALAGALLEALAGRAALTAATTHHASLKDLPARAGQAAKSLSCAMSNACIAA
jgi:dsDNA-specific endonuclease/ATPase MutS2